MCQPNQQSLSLTPLVLGLLVLVETISGFSVDLSFQGPMTDICARHEKDPPSIIVEEPWIHAGEKSTIILTCTICAIKPYLVWWTKDGKKLPEGSSRIRQMHNHHNNNEFLLRIRGVREKDFGEYECNVYVNETRIQRSATLNVTGVPYPAKFDLPTTWTDTTFTLSWKVNCSLNAPIINYQLEFKELPHGQWVVINIPAEINYELMNQLSRKRKKHGRNADNIHEFSQSYMIKGLTKGSRYKAKIRSRNEFGFSAETVLDLFQTFDMKDYTSSTAGSSAVDLFHRIPPLGKGSFETYYQDEPSSTTMEAPHGSSNTRKEFNSEPLSTKEDNYSINDKVLSFSSSSGSSRKNAELLFMTTLSAFLGMVTMVKH